MSEETYLGDGLYVSFDGWQLMLTADSESPAQRSVYVEPSVWTALKRYAAETIERT